MEGGGKLGKRTEEQQVGKGVLGENGALESGEEAPLQERLMLLIDR